MFVNIDINDELFTRNSESQILNYFIFKPMKHVVYGYSIIIFDMTPNAKKCFCRINCPKKRLHDFAFFEYLKLEKNNFQLS